MSSRAIIIEEIQRVAAEHHKPLGRLDDDAQLLSLGLDSLCFAILVFRLEERLDIDPFSEASEIQFPSTIGEFVEAYETSTVHV